MSGLRGCLGIENDRSTWKENSLVNKITSIARKPINENPVLPKAEWKILLVGDYPSHQKVRAANHAQGRKIETAEPRVFSLLSLIRDPLSGNPNCGSGTGSPLLRTEFCTAIPA